MAEQTALTATQAKAISIRDYMHNPNIVRQLEAALPKFLNAERFLRAMYTAILRNPRLLDCSKESLLSAMIEAAQLGLEPILGKAALVPYKKTVTFQPMYRGLIDLALRSDKISNITAHNVYSQDHFKVSYGTDEKLEHIPHMDGDRGDLKGSYTVWFFKDGTTTHLYMSVGDIFKIRDRSAAWKRFVRDGTKCPWNTDEGEMCKKTVIKRHSKLQPCSVEYEKALEYDDAIDRGEASSLITTATEIPPTESEDLTAKIQGLGEEEKGKKESYPPEWYTKLMAGRPGKSEKAAEAWIKDVEDFLNEIYALKEPEFSAIGLKYKKTTSEPLPSPDIKDVSTITPPVENGNEAAGAENPDGSLKIISLSEYLNGINWSMKVAVDQKREEEFWGLMGDLGEDPKTWRDAEDEKRAYILEKAKLQFSGT